MANWQRYTVEELERRGVLRVEDGNHGEYRPRSSEFGVGATTFIRAADMNGGQVLFGSAEHISDAAVARIRKGMGRGGDILFSHKGTVGKVARVPLDAPAFVCSPQTTFWRTVDEEQLDRKFLYAFMRSPLFVDQWAARKGETDMADYVSLTAQRELWVTVPPINEQRAIGRLLGAFDDKMDLNRRMNRTLEETASALFRSWFVDFDPVVAKAAGRAPLGMDAATAALFPASFEDSPIGCVPRGWSVVALGTVATVTPGKSYTSDDLARSEAALVSLKSVHRGGGYRRDGLKSFVGSFKPQHVVEPGEIVVACTDVTQNAEVVGRAAMVEADPHFRVLVASMDLLILRPAPDAISREFLYNLLRMSDYVEWILGWVNGTTVLHLNRDGVRQYRFALPSREIVQLFTERVGPMQALARSNSIESLTLAALRDMLLPKVLSGEIRPRDAERAVEAVA